jgi:signal transduction histidine kinase
LLRAGAHVVADQDNRPGPVAAIERVRHMAVKQRKAGRPADGVHVRQAHQMTALRQLASAVAHDLNNLLTAILGNVELMQAELRSRMAEDDQTMVALRQLERAGQRATVFTEQLLAFSRDDFTKAEVIAANVLLQELGPRLRGLLTERITLALEAGADVRNIYLDAEGFERVVTNLVVNARDAMPNGGKLIIRTESVFLDKHYQAQHPDTQSGWHVVLTVADTGTGIPADQLEKIFEPFFTTKTPGQAVGLGLTMVYAIVEQADGHIHVQSEPGHGTTVRLYFPAAAEPVAQPGKRESEKQGNSNTRVAVCEDEP